MPDSSWTSQRPPRYSPSSSLQRRYAGSRLSTRPASTNTTALKPSLRSVASLPPHESSRPSSNVRRNGRAGSATGSPRKWAINAASVIVR